MNVQGESWYSMNSSAFSCGVRGLLVHSAGKVMPVFIDLAM